MPREAGAGSNRRRIRVRHVVLILAIAFAGWLSWAVHWALTATPVGSAGLDLTLAEIAAWPDTTSDQSQRAYEAWLDALERAGRIREATAAALPPAAAGLEFGPADLLLDDADERWAFYPAETTDLVTGAERAAIRAALRSRLDAYADDGLVDALGQLARGPRPAPDAITLGAMGFGGANPFAVMLMDIGATRAIAEDLAAIARLAALDGDPARLVPTLDALEGLARGAEANPVIIGQLVGDAIRLRGWSLVADLAVTGRLDVATIDALQDTIARHAAGYPAGERGRRTRAAEMASMRAVLGHLYDAKGRPLPGEFMSFDGTPATAAGRLINLTGLFAARRSTVEERLIEAMDGTRPVNHGGFTTSFGTAFTSPDRLIGLLVPALDAAYERFRGSEAMPQILRVHLAVARNTAVNGAPPATLAALTRADGIETDGAPADPFGGAPLVYRLAPEDARSIDGVPAAWRLWSIGPNDVDDGADARRDLVLPTPAGGR